MNVPGALQTQCASNQTGLARGQTGGKSGLENVFVNNLLLGHSHDHHSFINHGCCTTTTETIKPAQHKNFAELWLLSSNLVPFLYLITGSLPSDAEILWSHPWEAWPHFFLKHQSPAPQASGLSFSASPWGPETWFKGPSPHSAFSDVCFLCGSDTVWCGDTVGSPYAYSDF